MKYRKEIMQIHRLAVPILMNYALTSVFEIFDEMIIGHYSVESFAFVGVASSILYTITGAFGSLSAAFHILAAELYGMQEYGKMEQTFAAAKLLATGIGDLYWQGCLAADGSSAISIHFPGRIWKSCFLIFILHRSLSCKI